MEQEEKIPFSILKEDYENSSKRFADSYNCPFNVAFRRQFPNLGAVEVFTSLIFKHPYMPWSPRLARIDSGFEEDNFNELADNSVEHHTFITFLN